MSTGRQGTGKRKGVPITEKICMGLFDGGACNWADSPTYGLGGWVGAYNRIIDFAST